MVMKMYFLFSFFLFFISFSGCENIIKSNKKENLDLYDYDVEQRIFEDMRDYCPILIPLVLRIAKLASYQKAA